VVSQVLWIGLLAGRLGDHTTAIKLTTTACRQYDSDGFRLDNEDRRYLARLEGDARAALGDANYNATRDGPEMAFQDSIELALTLSADSRRG
jgi:hypothetical protein